MTSELKISTLITSRRILIVVIFLALVIRLPGIFWGLPIFDKYAVAYHPDEPKIIYGALAFPEDIFHNEDLRYPTGLHYFVGILVLPLDALATSSLLSKTLFRDLTFIIARLVSISHGLGAIFLVYLFGKHVYNTNTGLIAAALLTVSLYHARHSSIATTDVTSSFWVMAVLIFLYRFSPKSRSREYVILGILTGLLTGVKYSGGIIVVAISIVLFRLLTHANNRKDKENVLIGGLIAVPIAMLALLFTTPTILVNPRALIASLQYESTRVGNSRLPIWDLQPLISDYRLLVIVVGLPLALLILYGVVSALKKSELRNSLPLIATLIVYVLFFWGSMLARYLILILPILCLLAARAFEPLLRTKIPYLRNTAIAVLSLTIGYSLAYIIAGNVLMLNDPRSAASAYFQENIPPGSTVGYSILGNTNRFSWTLPRVDSHIYEFIDGLNQPEYVILTSQIYKSFDRTFISGILPSTYVLDPQYANSWYLGIIPEPEVFEFYDYFLNGVGDKYHYQLIAVFEPPSITVPIEFPPPEIRIYKRVAN